METMPITLSVALPRHQIRIVIRNVSARTESPLPAGWASYAWEACPATADPATSRPYTTGIVERHRRADGWEPLVCTVLTQIRGLVSASAHGPAEPLDDDELAALVEEAQHSPVVHSGAVLRLAATLAAREQVDERDPTGVQDAPTDSAVRLELWHDTTMWNEGFERAREAVATVVVAPGVGERLRAWIKAGHSLSVPSVRDDRAFRCRTAPADARLPLLTEESARATLQQAIDAWEGLG